MKKLFLLLIAVMSFALSAQAQRSIKGQVTDAANGEPLMGATVQPVGGGNGTATDVDGNFSLNVSNSVKYLRVS